MANPCDERIGIAVIAQLYRPFLRNLQGYHIYGSAEATRGFVSKTMSFGIPPFYMYLYGSCNGEVIPKTTVTVCTILF